MPGISGIQNMTGHNSYSYCRFCEIRGIYHKHVYCPLKLPTDIPRHHPRTDSAGNRWINRTPHEVVGTLKRTEDSIKAAREAIVQAVESNMSKTQIDLIRKETGNL